jgi:hypothetical protein
MQCECECDTFGAVFEHTLSLPSMRRPRFSYSHTETVARDCRSLKMKLMGGRRTVASSASRFSSRFHALRVGRTFSSAATWDVLALLGRIGATGSPTTAIHIERFGLCRWAVPEMCKLQGAREVK